jgi:membrane protein DedA with SNARE-associated domain
LEIFAEWLVDLVQSFGYAGLFIATLLGNVFVPIPLEVIIIPAGYLVEQGEMQLGAVLAVTIAGDILGSLLGYYVAYHFGRRFIYAYGKYFFIRHEKMEMLEKFFASHGEISTLTGRLIPGLRHFMAFPAGLAHMNIRKFVAYTGVGGAVWIATLIGVGYIIGGNKDMIRHYMPIVTTGVICLVVLMIVVYAWRRRQAKRSKGAGDGMA